MISNKDDYINRLNQYINELTDELEDLTKEERHLGKRQDSLIKLNSNNKKRVKELDNQIYKLTVACNGSKKTAAIAASTAVVAAGTLASILGIHEVLSGLQVASAFEASLGLSFIPLCGLGLGAQVALNRRENNYKKNKIEPLNTERKETERSIHNTSKKIDNLDQQIDDVRVRKHEVEQEIKDARLDLATTLKKPNNTKFNIEKIYVPDENEYENHDVTQYASSGHKR